jgi:hypothetical protein
MNQDQRKFLIEQVAKTCKNEEDEIRSKLPTKPSLNNYLVAACLDNSIEIQDIEVIKSRIRDTVLKFGQGDVLITEEEYDWTRGRRRKRYDETSVTLKADDIFIVPEAYTKALAVYRKESDVIEVKLKDLHARRDTLIMKIQIGSSTALDKLVLQIDNMGDLNLMNNQLMLEK